VGNQPDLRYQQKDNLSSLDNLKCTVLNQIGCPGSDNSYMLPGKIGDIIVIYRHTHETSVL